MFMHILVLMVALMTAAPALAQPVKVVVLGDSLSAGLGLSAADAFPAKLQKALKDKGIEVDIDERRGVRRYRLRRPRPARLVGAAGN